MEALSITLIYFGFAFLIAKFLDGTRKIGFGWSFFLCIINPLLGFIITIISKKKT